MQAAPKIEAPLLDLIARNDGYSSVTDNQRLVRAAGSTNKRLVVYPEDWHGWDLLYHAPYKARVNALVFNFPAGPLAVGCDCDRGRGKPRLDGSRQRSRP